jgi:hypothetical protein
MSLTEEIECKLNQLVEDGKILSGLIKGEIASCDFTEAYQRWYTPALKLVSLLGKDRLDEFCNYYLANPSRGQLTSSTYVIQDYVSGVEPAHTTATRMTGTDFNSRSVIASKFESQFSLLKSLSTRIDSVLSDVTGHLLAELQDEELKVASQLVEVNLRAAGAVAGVVLEGHLQRVAANHGIIIPKKNPSVADLNDPLKANNVYDLITWRKIQHLADIRNYCDHKKEREPTEEEVTDLITGTDRIIKTIF